jgi:hypothetical protein
VQHHLHGWHGFLKRCERWWQYLHRGNQRVADVQLAIFGASQRAALSTDSSARFSNSRTSSNKSYLPP